MNAFLILIFVTLHVYGTLAYGYRGPAGPSPHLFARLPQSFSFGLDSSDDSITADDFAKVLISLPSTQRNQVYDALVSLTPFLEPGSNVYSFIESLPSAVSDQVSAIRNPYQFGGTQRSQFSPIFNSPGMGFTSLLAPLLAGGRLQPRPYGLPHPHRHRKSPGHTCHRRHRIISPTHGIDLDFTSIISTFPDLDDDNDEDSADKTNPEDSTDKTNPENSTDKTNPEDSEKTEQGDSNKIDTDVQQDPSSEGQNEKEADKSQVESSAADPAQDTTTTDDSLKSNDDKSGETVENTAEPLIVPEIAQAKPEESTLASEPTVQQPAPEQQPQSEQSTSTVDEPITVFSDEKAETQIESKASEEAAASTANPQTRSLQRPKKTKGQVKKRSAATNQANAASSAKNTPESESLSLPPASAATADESVADATNEVTSEKNSITEEPVRGKPKKTAGLARVPRRPTLKPQ